MLLHDAASRQYDDVIRDVCAAMRVAPRKLDPLPQRAMCYLRDAVQAAHLSMRRDPEISQGPYPYGVEAIEHAPPSSLSGRNALVEAVLGKRRVPDESGSVTSCGAVPYVNSDGTSPLHRTLPRRAHPVITTLLPGSDEAIPKLHSEGTLGEPAGSALASLRDVGLSKDADLARTHADALRRLAGIHVGTRPCAKAECVFAPGEPRRVNAHTRRTSTSILSDATSAVRLAKVTAMRAPAVLVATPVAKAGLDDVRAALVERSVADARGDEDGLGVRGASDDLLRGLLSAALRALDRRFADSTRALDKSYWKFWCEWCDLIGTPPLRTNVAANTGAIPHLHRREVAIALGGFMSFVADNCPKCKISSMLARMRGVARRHSAYGLKFVSLSAVVMAADGLVQEHIDVHGADSLLPDSKEPLKAAEIIAILNLESSMTGRAVGCATIGSNIGWQGVRVFVALMATMGCRKEAIALGPAEVPGPRKLMLHNITYRFDYVLVRVPTIEQLDAALHNSYADVMVYVHPVPCKNDPTNKKFGNSPVPSPLHLARPINLARELIRYEIMRRVDPARRKEAPLVLAPSGRMWAKKELDEFFKQLLALVVEPARLTRLSVHSFRVYLACSLLAAGATPEQIMQLLRWSSNSARKLYARLGEKTQVGLLESAADAHIDSVRSHTLLEATAAMGPLTRADSEARQAGEAVREGERLLDRALAHTMPLPTAEDLRGVVVIDDDAVYATIRNNFDALRSSAARHDAREGVEADFEEPEDAD